MDITLVFILRFFHITGGIFWAGAALFITLLLMPSIRAVGPEGGKIIQELQKRNLTLILTIAGAVTVVSGAILYWPVTGGFDLVYIKTGRGIFLTIGSLAGIAGLVIGFMSGQASLQMAALGKAIAMGGGPPDPEQAARMQALQARMKTLGEVNAVLLSIAVITMGTFRYIAF